MYTLLVYHHKFSQQTAALYFTRTPLLPIIVVGHPHQGRRPCGITPSGTTTATQPATAVSTNARVLVKANQATNRVAQPTDPTTTTDPNGEITPPLLCPVTTTVVDNIHKLPVDTLIKNLDSLTDAQRDTLNARLSQIRGDCIGASVYNYLTTNKISFSFTSNPSQTAQATYNPTTGGISIQDFTTLSASNLEEEFVHAIQNAVYNGIAKYSNTASANIEFEAKLLLNISSAMNTTPSNFAINNDPNYGLFLQNLTNNYTSYPTSFTSSQLGWYDVYLGEFIQSQYNTGYTNDVIDYNFAPKAIFQIISLSACAHQ